MAKVVRQISTQDIVYRQSPDFEDGKGIANAVAQKNIPENDLEEITE